MGVSFGAAIDYLYSGTNASTQTKLLTDLRAADSTAILVDSWPQESSQSTVVIGRQSDVAGVTQTGSRQIQVLGAQRELEDYLIQCFILVRRPGPSMKPARDAAIGLFDTFAHWLAADRTLGGVLLQGRYCSIENVALDQDNDSDAAGNAGAMHIATISFDIHCQNPYIP